MSTSSQVHDERSNLADLLAAAGPDAPTLCEGWTTRDLAAHLVIREGRPDAAAGIVIAPFAGWTGKVQAKAAERPYAELVEAFRQGPPRWSPFSIPAVDAAANTIEFIVHGEDVRRAAAQWTPRVVSPELNELLYARATKMARLSLRKVPLGVALERTDTAAVPVAVKTGTPIVTVAGVPLDLMLRLFGRTAVDVEVRGDAAAVAAFNAARISM
jgi:uncharacterized protein (TIGR03085 family)